MENKTPPNSPRDGELKRRKLDHIIDLENKQADNIWQASCIKLDRRCLIFCNQVLFGLILTIFCMMKLTRELSTEEQMVYLSLLSTVTGIFLPSPSIKRD
jgi:hypothetical protein